MTDSPTTPAAEKDPITICVVAHTHWDREWYHQASRFRQQLVALVDTLFTMPESNAFPFLLDGQAVVLEDYLSVRPEMAGQLAAALKAGLIEAGPWYVLADGLIPSGEAIVRNLLAGRRFLRRFGAVPPAVAYCPDTFGHSAAIPAIAEGFGFPVAIVWRGYGGARWPKGDTVRWHGAGGESVLMYHLPPDGYETGSALPTESAQVAGRWASFRELMSGRTMTNVVMLPNGADHHALQPDIAEAIGALKVIAQPDVVVRESLAGFAKRLVAATSSQHPVLPIVQGELRDSYGFTWTLGGTFGTRAAQKRSNAKAERLLLRDVEPWLALAWLHGERQTNATNKNATVSMSQLPALLDVAWRTLLRAHPHDTLCGCSIDAVARAMDMRIESAVAQARGLRVAALNIALKRDTVAARGGSLAKTAQLLVRNRVAHWRGGLAEVLLDETMDDAPVGPSSAGISARIAQQSGSSPMIPIVSGFPLQVIQSKEVFRRRESPQHYPDNDLVRAHRALAWVPAVPPVGLAIHPLRFEETKTILDGTKANFAADAQIDAVRNDGMPRPVSMRVNGDEIELTNSRITVVVGPRGVQITGDQRTLQDALTFESTKDVGDSYTPAIRGDAETLQITSVKPALSGPLRASVVVELRTPHKRNSVRVRATIILDAESDIVRVDIHGNNRRRNHRLRVNFNTDVVATRPAIAVYADAAFGPVERLVFDVPAEDQTREMVPDTMPMHRWATMCTTELGATLHSDGLAEVEAKRSSGALSLTLLRAIGQLSRSDLPERPGHAGWPTPIPAAQSIGIFRARIGLHIHGAWSQPTRDAIEAASNSFLLPLTGETIRDLSEVPGDITGPRLSGSALRLSAVTLADDGDGIILRCVNDSNESQHGSWTLPNAESLEFAHARLDETLESAWTQTAHEFNFVAAPRAIVTVRVRRRSV